MRPARVSHVGDVDAAVNGSRAAETATGERVAAGPRYVTCNMMHVMLVVRVGWRRECSSTSIVVRLGNGILGGPG